MSGETQPIENSTVHTTWTVTNLLNDPWADLIARFNRLHRPQPKLKRRWKRTFRKLG